MNWQRGALVLVLAWLGAGQVQGEDLQAAFQRANSHYAEGDFNSAREQYVHLAQAGIFDCGLAINVGNAAARLERFGEAIRWYELCLRADPGDSDANAGLSAVTAALGKARAAREGGVAEVDHPTLSSALVRPFPESLLATALLVINFAFWLVLGATLLGNRRARILVLPAFAGLLLTAAGLAIRQDMLSPGEAFVVTTHQTPLHDAPGDRGTALGTAFEGDRGWVVDQHDGYVNVMMSNGTRGWILARGAASLRRPEDNWQSAR